MGLSSVQHSFALSDSIEGVVTNESQAFVLLSADRGAHGRGMTDPVGFDLDSESEKATPVHGGGLPD